MSFDRDPTRPGAEPEIIPPGAAMREPRPGRGEPRVRVFIAGTDPSGRVRLKVPGPFTIAAVLLGLGLLVGLLLFLALGALLIVLPVTAVVLSLLIAAGVLRRSFRGGSRRNVPRRRP